MDWDVLAGAGTALSRYDVHAHHGHVLSPGLLLSVLPSRE